ncbi:5-formyltetrahydrofolate cyclo-ligase [Granulosicoccus antarcticus]|uniref:5-formyltetrahydrofolate cyclo-ligase n=1 Tax=Granulosicoccus antarcticus IMCC3135 TaxID=1192854 RepID=A0A2Z2P3H1_9GAMM|nr:5-formyltetrahydrofolate cyclo-ligase [Granulosicoccus antarcticus]ASJ75980.1 5-formyltetrahydrofolate cyclo-ligase [Granulosicoccus antarcticus IMCC3135]
MTPDNTAPPATADKNSERDDTRQQLQQLRKLMDPAMIAVHSSTIAANILTLSGNALKIGAYLAFGHEVNVDEFMAQCRDQGQSTYVPLIQSDNTLIFASLTDDTPIILNKYAIREPVTDQKTCLPATSLDIVIVPLLGFDAQCQRMGMGGGYYDRTFAYKRQALQDNSINPAPLLIGVAFESQCVDSVFPDWWDVTLDHVVTEKNIYSRNGPVTPIR